jgi:hypothetical protein
MFNSFNFIYCIWYVCIYIYIHIYILVCRGIYVCILYIHTQRENKKCIDQEGHVFARPLKVFGIHPIPQPSSLAQASNPRPLKWIANGCGWLGHTAQHGATGAGNIWPLRVMSLTARGVQTQAPMGPELQKCHKFHGFLSCLEIAKGAMVEAKRGTENPQKEMPRVVPVGTASASLK